MKYLLIIILLIQPLSLLHAKNIAVLNLDMTSGVSQMYQLTLSDRLRQELHYTGKYSVMERNRMEDILAEQAFQISGCFSNECLVDAGKLLGIESIVAGSIGKVGNTFSINVRLIDVESGKMILTASVDSECTIDEVLTGVIPEIAEMLASNKSSKKHLKSKSNKEKNQPLSNRKVMSVGDYSLGVNIGIFPLMHSGFDKAQEISNDQVALPNDGNSHESFIGIHLNRNYGEIFSTSLYLNMIGIEEINSYSAKYNVSLGFSFILYRDNQSDFKLEFLLGTVFYPLDSNNDVDNNYEVTQTAFYGVGVKFEYQIKNYYISLGYLLHPKKKMIEDTRTRRNADFGVNGIIISAGRYWQL